PAQLPQGEAEISDQLVHPASRCTPSPIACSPPSSCAATFCDTISPCLSAPLFGFNTPCSKSGAPHPGRCRMCEGLRHSHAGHGNSRRAFLSTAFSAAALTSRALAQAAETPAEMAEAFRRRSEDYERKGLAEPFRGIAASGGLVPGLFEIRPSGVATEPVRSAAERFVASLTGLQLARTVFPVDDDQW